MLHYCLEAAELVSAEGIDVEVVDLRTLKPLDHETILESIKKTGKLLIVHEDNITGGVGSEIAALAAAEAFEYLVGPLQGKLTRVAVRLPLFAHKGKHNLGWGETGRHLQGQVPVVWEEEIVPVSDGGQQAA